MRKSCGRVEDVIGRAGGSKPRPCGRSRSSVSGGRKRRHSTGSGEWTASLQLLRGIWSYVKFDGGSNAGLRFVLAHSVLEIFAVEQTI